MAWVKPGNRSNQEQTKGNQDDDRAWIINSISRRSGIFWTLLSFHGFPNAESNSGYCWTYNFLRQRFYTPTYQFWLIPAVWSLCSFVTFAGVSCLMAFELEASLSFRNIHRSADPLRAEHSLIRRQFGLDRWSPRKKLLHDCFFKTSFGSFFEKLRSHLSTLRAICPQFFQFEHTSCTPCGISSNNRAPNLGLEISVRVRDATQ